MRTTLLVSLSLVACASGPIATGEKPSWVTRASDDPRFPPDKFVAAVGSTSVGAKTAPELLATVDAAARAELAAALSSTISSEVKSVESLQTVNGKSDERLSAEQRVHQVVEGFDLTAAITIAGRWREGDTAYAWGVLDKAKALSLQQGKIADRARLAQDLVAQGDAAVATAPADALRAYARGRAEAEAGLNGVLLLRALGGKAEPAATAAEAQGKFAVLLGKLVVTVVDGDRQRGAEGRALAQPIVFTAWLAGKPAAGLPLAVQLASGRVDSAVVVAPDGRAAVRVDDVGKFGKAEQQISVGVDWARVLGVEAARLPAWADPAGKPLASAVALKKGVETTRVLVLLSEKVEGGNPVTEPPVTASVTAALQRAGFDVQNAKAFVERVHGDGLQSLNVAQLKEQARGLAEVVVVGSVTSRYSSNFGGTTVWHRARADVRAIDVGSGQVVFQSSADEVKSKRPGEVNAAGRSALEALGEALSPSLEKALLAAAAQ